MSTRTRPLLGIGFGLAIAACGAARAQDAAHAVDPAAVDPFENAPATQATNPSAQDDPFAAAQPADASSDAPSRFTRSLKFLYQGTYLPDLIDDHGADETTEDFFLDAALHVAATDDATFGARVVANHEDSKFGPTTSHDGEVSALEYFYRQQFAGATQAVTIGRKTMDWSSGFQWRPADLIDNGFSTKNINIENPYRYRGVDQLRYELIQPGFEGVAILSNRDRAFFGGDQLAAKLTVKSVADFSLLASINGDYERKYGVIVDSNLPWATTMALEAVHVDIDRNKLTDAEHFGRTLESLSGVASYEDVYLTLTKFIDDKRRVSLEYFHNGRGFADASEHAAPQAAPAVAAAPAIDPNIFSQQYLSRDYAYLSYTGYVDAWKLQFKPSVLVNLSDGSYSSALTVERELSGSSDLTVYVDAFHGGAGTEFGSVTHGLGAGVSYVFHFF